MKLEIKNNNSPILLLPPVVESVTMLVLPCAVVGAEVDDSVAAVDG